MTGITSIRVNDRGKYHDTKVYFSLKKSYEADVEDQLLIKYGRFKNFIPCSIYFLSAPHEHVFVAASNVGNLMDIKLMEKELLAVFKIMEADGLYLKYQEIFEKRNKIIHV